MKIITWNVNGIRAVHRKGDFQRLLETHSPDVICLQETKAERGQVEIDLPDYEEYWHSAKKKGYSGTAIFVKKSIEVLSVTYGFPKEICEKYDFHKDEYGDPNTEGRVIAAELSHFYIVSVYTPNSKGDLSRLPLRHKHWDPAFLAYMKILEEKKPVIFAGDLNVAHTEEDLANPKANRGEHGFTDEEREGVDNMVEAGFVDAFRHLTPSGNGHYTWWTHWGHARERNVGWRIDYFFVSKPLAKHVEKVAILDQVFGSDHCPVELVLKDF